MADSNMIQLRDSAGTYAYPVVIEDTIFKKDGTRLILSDTSTLVTTDDLTVQTTAINTQIDDLKTSVSSGKTLVANAITDKGVATSSSDTFATMSTNISNITTSVTPIVQVTNPNATVIQRGAVLKIPRYSDVAVATGGSYGSYSNGSYVMYDVYARGSTDYYGCTTISTDSNGKLTSSLYQTSYSIHEILTLSANKTTPIYATPHYNTASGLYYLMINDTLSTFTLGSTSGVLLAVVGYGDTSALVQTKSNGSYRFDTSTKTYTACTGYALMNNDVIVATIDDTHLITANGAIITVNGTVLSCLMAAPVSLINFKNVYGTLIAYQNGASVYIYSINLTTTVTTCIKVLTISSDGTFDGWLDTNHIIYSRKTILYNSNQIMFSIIHYIVDVYTGNIVSMATMSDIISYSNGSATFNCYPIRPSNGKTYLLISAECGLVNGTGQAFTEYLEVLDDYTLKPIYHSDPSLAFTSDSTMLTNFYMVEAVADINPGSSGRCAIVTRTP